MELKQSVKEALGYYVYALVDPRDRKFSTSAKVRGTGFSNMQKPLL